MSRYVLTVDLGTGGPKVGLVSTRGEIVWWEHHPVTTTYGAGGSATQDPEVWWQLVVAATRRGLAESSLSDLREKCSCSIPCGSAPSWRSRWSSRWWP